jgi:AcrR family transcriptional regulator
VSPTSQAPVDGRSARRERNSDRVLDAVHELFVEDQRIPSVEEVAVRAGVSLRSVYRYFPDTGQLMAAALARRTRAVEDDWHLPRLGEGSLEERIAAFVDHRLFLHETAGPTIRAALVLADREPLIAAQIEQRRSQVAAQTRAHFAPELEAMPPEPAADTLHLLEVLGQFESVDILLARRGLSTPRARAVLVAGITAVLAVGGRARA